MKALFYGVAIATTAGLLCGGAMKIHARAGERPEGPQMLVSGPPVRGLEADGGVVLTAYGAEPPSYVLGTDWLRTVAYAEEAAPAAEAIREAVHETPAPYAPPPQYTEAVYPSVEGDILAGVGETTPAPSRQAYDRLDAVNAQIAMDGQAAVARIARSPS